jgi:hypothetical protein
MKLQASMKNRAEAYMPLDGEIRRLCPKRIYNRPFAATSPGGGEPAMRMRQNNETGRGGAGVSVSGFIARGSESNGEILAEKE